ncbi:MBL fold metallo-hydrolase [Longimicrobium terrae]|uniref:Glyoxylase-like metal-dependent hydrolase (Beta-lactamase superfamily II) n=1 Tax=Longimicrobium terrae TaxID=1639882 RepID=A0A841H6N2_9BACT|nr:MBL fold metallo-hydrolase [Longimicrobium terrae]MBB4639596.1 glyoxylase-like metal-dependent hydrolase (beta-lactamase superfamily II) [Longimicrobium terrae]MBB6073945.1 glyoxylase-like metal-dependent hydrolase (beta-lactamase superfamily II) [Longimicrobium terrae]NNC29110.1 MBL fold metallo-hydrolase [Longimicrobium terrae]
MRRIARLLTLLALPLAAAGCTMHLNAVEGPASIAIPTSYPWESTIYAVRTESGVLLVDLGWTGAARPLRRGLARIGARPEDVTDVFVTHSHRDHIGAWRAVQQARFHVGASERAMLESLKEHADLPSRAGDLVLGNPAPWPGEVNVHSFSADTVMVIGGDTVRAFLNPGHTAGSASYLIRGVLYVGDAVYRSYVTGYRPASHIFTADHAQSRASLVSLFDRVRPYSPAWVCTAHGKCARPDERFIRKVLGDAFPDTAPAPN